MSTLRTEKCMDIELATRSRSITTTFPIAAIALWSVATACSSVASGTTDELATMEASPEKPAAQTPSQVASFQEPSEVSRWKVINDGVMGGKSQSALRARPAGAAFYGTVSADNGGGFASIRSLVEEPLTDGLQAVSLRIRGDGKRYQFRIRTNKRWDGPSYVNTFDTKAGMWQDVVLPLSDFQASFRGRRLSNVAPLKSREIQQIGFLIADEQYGYFNL
jgi:NADH dehydrogenase [ubiquinone] 1 alpha subcomplex assembly factor 1